MSPSTSATCTCHYEWSDVLAKRNTSTISMPYYTTTPALKRGDRVRIREGYDSAGAVGFYESKSNDTDGVVLVVFGDTVVNTLLAAAIEPYPYSREERIERAIEDFIALTEWTVPLSADDGALLFAILDEGV